MLPYETIFSRVRNKCNDPKELSLDENDLNEIYTERLHSVAGDIRIMQMFSTLVLNDETQTLEWVLKNPMYTNNQSADKEYVIELFTLGMIIEWLKPKVEDGVAIADAIGGKEEKVLKNMHSANVNRLETLENKLNRKICDHGYLFNSYIRDYV